MNIIEQECKGGFKIELSPFKKVILSCTSTGGHKIELNDRVSSNGRVFCPKGALGQVIEIDEPFKDLTTDHVFLVYFEEHGRSYHMGFQDLEFEFGSYTL